MDCRVKYFIAPMAALFLLACSDRDAADFVCHANVDCEIGEACVLGECIDDKGECQVSGAFEEVVTIQPKNAQEIFEMHVTVDSGGATHYCYFAEVKEAPVGFYGVQTAWDTFEETPLAMPDGAAARCGAIEVDREGRVFVLVRNHSAILVKEPDADKWKGIDLNGIQGVEGSGALLSKRSLISLTPDSQGGAYLGLSLGYQLEAQPVYLAHIAGNALEILVNGWSEVGDYTATGHAPQFLVEPMSGDRSSNTDSIIPPTGGEQRGGDAADIPPSRGEQRGVEPRVLLGQVTPFKVQVADESLNIQKQVSGLYPRGASTPWGSSVVAYMNHNYELVLKSLVDGDFWGLATIGEVGIDESGDGQVPWDLVVDTDGLTHLLYEDRDQAAGMLIHRKVRSKNDTGQPRMVTTSLATDLPGMQRYAMGTDICGRATVAVVEEAGSVMEPDAGTTADAPVIRVVEGR